MTDPVSEGVRLLEMNRVNEALECFEAGQDARAWFGRGVALHLLGRLDAAETAYLRSLELSPNPETLANLVALAVEKFDLERVETYSARLLELDPDAAVAWQGLLVVALERSDLDAAAEYFRRVDGRTVTADASAIQYRLSGHTADRLRAHEPKGQPKGEYGAVARAR